MAKLVKNLPARRETWVRSLGWEDPLEKGKATHSSILAWTEKEKSAVKKAADAAKKSGNKKNQKNAGRRSAQLP